MFSGKNKFRTYAPPLKDHLIREFRLIPYPTRSLSIKLISKGKKAVVSFRGNALTFLGVFLSQGTISERLLGSGGI